MATYINDTSTPLDLTAGPRLRPGGTVELDTLPTHEAALVDAGALRLVSGSTPPAPVTPAFVRGIGVPTIDLRGAPEGTAIGVDGAPLPVATVTDLNGDPVPTKRVRIVLDESGEIADLVVEDA